MDTLSERVHLPRIAPLIETLGGSASAHLYAHSIRHILRRIVEGEFLFEERRKEMLHYFHEMLPIISWVENYEESSHLSIFLLCKHRPQAAKFFYDMLSRWLIPGKRLEISLFFAADFILPDWGKEVYTVAEIAFAFEDEAMLRNLTLIEDEIRLGLASAYHASRILEAKGLSSDDKTSEIQERIATLVRRRPQDFDYDIFSEMQHFLVMCKEEFKTLRQCRLMVRIIYIFYLFRKALRKLVEEAPQRRHLSLKIAQAQLQLPLGMKQVLSIIVGMNFLKDYELFEESHLVAALCTYIPGIRAVEDSFFASMSREDKIQTIYLEVEKSDSTPFTLQEMRKLRLNLPEDLKARVEQLTHPIFMPRNEEEVMRNILTLGKQLKYLRDVPQVNITFDAQSDDEISFLVVMARILNEGALPTSEVLLSANSDLKFQVDRIRKIGMIRNKHPKEACVFRARLESSAFIRKDGSVDLYKARQRVVEELHKIFDEIRDYNGGMISKQIEAFNLLKDSLGAVGRQHDLLLENFFHAIFPVELRSVLPVEPLHKLFLLLLELMDRNSTEVWQQEPGRSYAIFHLCGPEHEERVNQALAQLQLAPPQLVMIHLKCLNTSYFGSLYLCEDEEKQERFRKALSLDFRSHSRVKI